MADKEFYTGIDLKENYISNANVPDVDESDPDSSAIPKGYCDEKTIYNTTLADGKQVSDIAVGGIAAGTQVFDKTVKELLDNMFYPLQPAVYYLPTLSFVINKSGYQEVGDIFDINCVSNFTIRDSDGLRTATPYTYEGAGITVPVESNLNTYTLSNYTTTEGTNSWIGRVKYLGSSVIKNDTHGNPDTSGQFADGELVKSDNFTGAWPIFAQVLDGNIAAPTTPTQLRANDGKSVSAIPSEFTIIIPSGGTKTVILAIPTTSKTLEVIKDGALPITASFIKQGNLVVTDLNSTGQTKTYSLWRHTNGVGYTTNSEYIIRYK